MKKIENDGIVLEDTFLGEESQTIKKLKNEVDEKYEKIDSIQNEISINEDTIKLYKKI